MKVASSDQFGSLLSAFLLSFRFRLFSLRFSSFDTFPRGGHGVGASSIDDPSDTPFFSSPSSSLEVSARFVPTVLPVRAAQEEEGAADEGYPMEDPEWEGRGGGEGEGVGTALGEVTNAVVDTAEERTGEGELGGVRAEWGE
jgi:hypothetical protein